MTPASAAPHWLVRSIGSAALTPSLLLAVVGTTLLALGVRGSAAASSYGSVIAVSLALVALGCAALTIACGQIGTALALRARPGPLLRNE